jgi:hypothetical protein
LMSPVLDLLNSKWLSAPSTTTALPSSPQQ